MSVGDGMSINLKGKPDRWADRRTLSNTGSDALGPLPSRACRRTSARRGTARAALARSGVVAVSSISNSPCGPWRSPSRNSESIWCMAINLRIRSCCRWASRPLGSRDRVTLRPCQPSRSICPPGTSTRRCAPVPSITWPPLTPVLARAMGAVRNGSGSRHAASFWTRWTQSLTSTSAPVISCATMSGASGGKTSANG
jgi:hypothetical protein